MPALLPPACGNEEECLLFPGRKKFLFRSADNNRTWALREGTKEKPAVLFKQALQAQKGPSSDFQEGRKKVKITGYNL